MRAILKALVTLTALTMALVPAGAAQDEPSSVFSMEADAAFGGHFKYGEWLPIWVRLENDGPDLHAEIQVQVGGAGTTTFAAAAVLPTGSRKRIPLYVLPNSYSHELEVRLVAGDNLLASRTVAVNPQPNIDYLIGLMAPRRGALSLIQGAELTPLNGRKELIDISLSDLPERAEGLKTFDALILNDVDTSLLSPAQAMALENWVRQGGQLVIGGGPGAMHTLIGLPESLRPLTLTGVTSVDRLPALGEFAGAEAAPAPGPFFAATGEPAGSVPLVKQDSLVLVYETTIDDGSVEFAALDLAASPFDAWAGTPAFWERLLSASIGYPEWLPPDVSARQIHANTMASALSNIPALDLPSIRGLGILLAVYIILVGPINYLILRSRQRLHWAWVTIPLLTISFSTGAFGLAYSLRGSDLLLNRIAVIALQSNGTARISSYMGIFSPSQESYEVEVGSGRLVAPLRAGYDPWQIGDVNSSGEAVFLQGEPGLVRGLTVDQWSLQSFMTEGVWNNAGQLASDLRLDGAVLEGSVRNETAYALTDVVLILGNDFVGLGDLAPGTETAVRWALPDPSGRWSEPPLSYRLFERESAEGDTPASARQAQLKRAILSDILQGSSRPWNSLASADRGRTLTGLTLMGWTDTAPPEVRVAGKTPNQRTLAVLYTSLSYSVPEEGAITLRPGLISGAVIQMPQEGGPCGPETSILLGRGEAVFEFRLPSEIQDVQVNTLQLMLEADGSHQLPPDVALYDWDGEEWITLEAPAFGINSIDHADQMVRDGQVRVRLAAPGGHSGGCLYVELGMAGTRQPVVW